MLDLDVCWRQRLQNYSSALALLRSALVSGLEALNDLEQEGTVRRFEYTVELAWKTLKDYLEFSGVQLASVTPKSAIKAAFAARLVPEGQLWIDMLDHRNLLSHKSERSPLGQGPESDIDIALHGDVDESLTARIAGELEELPLPYTFDVLAYSSLWHSPLREHIDRVGRWIFTGAPSRT